MRHTVTYIINCSLEPKWLRSLYANHDYDDDDDDDDDVDDDADDDADGPNASTATSVDRRMFKDCVPFE